ncbi:lipocalin-like domain-containing protein [Algoriphagus namhaensis]
MKTKNLHGLYSFGLLLVLAFTLTSCGKSPQELIVGTWSGTDFEFEQTQGPDMSAVVEGGRDLHLDGKMILEETGTYIISDPDNVMNGKGTWKINSDELVLTDDQKNEVVYELISISESKLVIMNEVAMETPMGNLAGKITLTYQK